MTLNNVRTLILPGLDKINRISYLGNPFNLIKIPVQTTFRLFKRQQLIPIIFILLLP